VGQAPGVGGRASAAHPLYRVTCTEDALARVTADFPADDPSHIRERRRYVTPALPKPDLEPLCVDCVKHEGLCRAHERAILPQLAQPSWVRLIGLQAVKKTSAASPAAQRAMRRNAKRLERMQRAIGGGFTRTRKRSAA
jgi:hypothetical protein